ncbi:MAG: DNA repair protein RecN [Sphingobacteriaceae bacterium]|nr:DNA repair protein RecN [Sphingobacteriaceae bacterium]
MLQKLTIRNYALIDSVDVEFDAQLNIITGETGAGKSIILGALSLILGQRAETKYFFNQDKKCVIEGFFKLENENLKELFDNNELDFHLETILRREISIDGKSRAFINDSPVNLTLMKQIGEKLIDIHSQHATLEINDANFQLSVVDSLANHGSELFAYKSGFKQFQQKKTALKKMQIENDERSKKQDYEQFLFDELEQADLKIGEQADLELELQLLSNAEEIKRNLLNSSILLTEQELSVSLALKECVGQLQHIEKFNATYNELTERLKSVLVEVKDISSEIIRLEDDVVFNPQRIEFINHRLDLIYTLQQKHRVTEVTDLLLIRDNLSASLANLMQSDEEIERLKIEIDFLKVDLFNRAKLISTNRHQAIDVIEKQVEEILHKIGMPSAKIKIENSVLDEFSKDGLDLISLLFSANLGQLPAPVSKVASGGELSRLMLAIKSIMAKHTDLPTIIFDEVDTGISGEVALRVGSVIDELSKNMQVVCITHLPQIAAKGETHYFVYKNEIGERTTTSIKKLNNEDRIITIAEMLSGSNPGLSAIENAKDLLN